MGLRTLRTMRKSVILGDRQYAASRQSGYVTHSAPACPPNPKPPTPIALGGDQPACQFSWCISELTSVLETSDNETASNARRGEEANFDDGEDGESRRALKHAARDDTVQALVRAVDERANRLGRLLAFLLQRHCSSARVISWVLTWQGGIQSHGDCGIKRSRKPKKARL